MTSWLQAVKEFASKNGKWIVPKKGTPEYEAVKKIQEDMKAKAEPKAVVEKEKKPKKAKETVDVAEELAKKPVRQRKPKAKAEIPPTAEAKVEVKPEIKTETKVEVKSEVKPEVKVKKLNPKIADGKSTGAVTARNPRKKITVAENKTITFD